MFNNSTVLVFFVNDPIDLAWFLVPEPLRQNSMNWVELKKDLI